MATDGAIYLSYHNKDIDRAFRLAMLLLRCYRRVWLDRFEVAPGENWHAGIRQARDAAAGAVAVVSDSYLQSPLCQAEFAAFTERGLPVTAVIARDFSTGNITDYQFTDWIDFRRWFSDPREQNIEELLNRVPQAGDMPEPGQRLDYLRGFIHQLELSLANMPTAWAALRNADAAGGSDIRPRNGQFGLLRDWAFTGHKSGAELPVSDLAQWAQTEPQFVLRGAPGSGKTVFAQLLALEQAHVALRDEAAPLPIWLDLALWREDLETLDAFVESQWQLLTYWRHWLEERASLLLLDNYSELQAQRPEQAQAVREWIDASPRHRFIVLSRGYAGDEPKLPTLEIGAITTALAQKFARRHLPVGQQYDFRQLLRQKSEQVAARQVDYLSLGIELLAADRALAHSQWSKDPSPALVALRLQQEPDAAGGLGALQLLRGLQSLAWSMMLAESHRFIPRAAAEREAKDPRVVPAAVALGFLGDYGGWLCFQPEALQFYLAAEPLKHDGLLKFIKAPEFTDDGEWLPRKWDKLALLIITGLAEESREQALLRISAVDPYLAMMALQGAKPISTPIRQVLLERLLQLCAERPAARRAFRQALAGLPDADATAQALIGQLGRYNSDTQLWLWQELRALPLEMPLDFFSLLADVDRENPANMLKQLDAQPLALSAAWLVKLSVHPEEKLRRNSIWMLGELKYLPTAILLLDDLQNGDGSDQSELLPALMKFAYSEILARVLRWAQPQPGNTAAVVRALAQQKRLVTSRLLAMADVRLLTLTDEFYTVVVERNETEIAIGLAQVIGEAVALPDEITTAILSHRQAEELRQEIAAVIKHLPNRDQYAQLVADIGAVLRDPPDATVLAGSKLEALVFGQSPFVKETAQAAASAPALPANLRRQLQHDDWQQRYRALNSLVDYPAAQSLPALLSAIDDSDQGVRLAAYEVLARFADESAAQKPLIAALSDPDTATVRAVTDLLKTAPDLDCEALLNLLESANPPTVAAAIEIVAEKKYPAALPDLERLLASPLTLADGRAISQLARAAMSEIESAAAEAAPAPGGSATAGFTDSEKISRTLQVLRDDDWGRTQKAAKFLRRFARHLRGNEDSQTLDMLCEALDDDNWSVRWAVAEALAVLRNPAAGEHLRRRLNDENWIVQIAVVRSLAELRVVASASEMARLLSHENAALREATAESLGKLRQPQVIPALGEVMQGDRDEFARFAALRAIHQINPQQARPWLELALSDASLPMWHFALQQLVPQMTDSDLPLLQKMLEDQRKPEGEDESLHDLAVRALRKIDSAASRALLDEPPQTAESASA
ncbi:MAG: HEAT repeat domain-containing protein [Chloroflexi bacterium]|nr:HEAT repeat domain-containing protein [Chloroflexota bacterium]MCY3583331.1 HEAT repeat domain-containing protein [Chloroflexota bacterium]MCY3716328.1 HEAT repeat domain-containing protein [Chloroflexota bacterium]MDE2651345.1 HEAT repeat domain-containing protein [Chloroflexota bacterium]MXX82113.1 TIR domain-containing protein [Chloroflexota bacterium]